MIRLRRIFRIHLTTAIILMLVASVLVFLNVPEITQCNKPDPNATTKGCLITYEVHSLGWPLKYSQSIFTGTDWYADNWGDKDISFWDFCYRKNTGIRWAFFFDLGIWISILGLTVACSERWIEDQIQSADRVLRS